MLMFGNLLRECGVLDSLSDTAQHAFSNSITLLLGLTIASTMKAEAFVNLQTVMILALGLLAFVFDTMAGCLFAKFLNLFTKNKIIPMVGAGVISPSVVGGGHPEFGVEGSFTEPPVDARRGGHS
jgi:oxaloacetate decarboxylase beta subunit